MKLVFFSVSFDFGEGPPPPPEAFIVQQVIITQGTEIRLLRVGPSECVVAENQVEGGSASPLIACRDPSFPEY